MTLHDAIEQLLKQVGRPMTTSEIANELNQNKWYQKKDGSNIDPFQIHGRTNNYSHIFNRNGSIVSLNGQSKIKVSKPTDLTIKQKPELIELLSEIALLEKVLMNEKNFKSARIIDNLVPDNPGLYCIRVKDINKLPKPFDSIAKDRNHNIIYIGIASQSLSKRFLNQELRAKGHGTFFRSIGAVLGYKPNEGSLLTKSNKRNYTFLTSDEQEIIEWINANLIINWVEFNGDFESVEAGIIRKHLPLLNLAKNPLALKQLSNLRAECVRIANN